MKKKIFLLFSVLCCGLLFTGCNEVIELSDEETDMIAEYAAGLLLQYDANYVDRIAAVEDSTEVKEEQPGTEGIQEPATEMTEEKATEEASKGNNLNSNIDETGQIDQGTEAVGRETNIAKIAGLENVDITYKDYIITDHYPATDEDGEFIYLDASDGYQLLVVRFRIVGTANEEVAVSLFDKKIGYRIICNGKHAADPMLTILMDDLGTFETTLQPGQEQEAVLVFQISDSVKDNLSSMQLKVNYNNVDNIINILN